MCFFFVILFYGGVRECRKAVFSYGVFCVCVCLCVCACFVPEVSSKGPLSFFFQVGVFFNLHINEMRAICGTRDTALGRRML